MIKVPVITESQVKKIHEATLKVLSTTGIVLDHPEAKVYLLNRGAEVKGNRVTIPAQIIEETLLQIPTEIVISGRDPQHQIKFQEGRLYAHNVGGVPNTLNPLNRIRRPAIRDDNVRSTRLLDSLSNVASITPLYTPQDVPGDEMSLWMTYDTLNNTTKPFRTPGVQTGLETRAIAELFKIACPSGMTTVGVSPVSPLTFPNPIVDAIFEVARQGFVLGPLPCPILGATAPMSIAGGLTQQNAEILASIVLAYIIRPGLSVIYKGRLSVMDPYTGLSVWGNPEIGLISAASTALAHFYHLPVDVYGFSTNAHVLDIQNGYERALNAVAPVLAGANEISGIGEMEGGLSSSIAQIIIDDEILSSILRLKDGFSVDPDHMAIDVIEQVMSSSHNYLAEKHTIKTLRNGEVLNPNLAVRDSWSQWEENGFKDIVKEAEESGNLIINHHEINPLSDDILSEMRNVIRLYHPGV